MYFVFTYHTCADPERGQWDPDPLKNHKNIGFLSNTGPDPLKITKVPSQHSMLGHYRYASKTPFKCRFTGGTMMARFKCYLDPLSIIPWTPLTKLSRSTHVTYTQKPPFDTNGEVSSRERDLKFGSRLHQYPYYMYARS